MVLASRFLLAHSSPFFLPRILNTKRTARVVVTMGLSATTSSISTAATANTPEQANSNIAGPSDSIKCASLTQKVGQTEEKREIKILMLHGKKKRARLHYLPINFQIKSKIRLLEFIGIISYE